MKHRYHRFVAHANLVRDALVGGAGRAEDERCFARHVVCLQGTVIMSESPDSGIGRHVFGLVTGREMPDAVERRSDHLEGVAHRARSGNDDDLLKLLAKKGLTYHLLHPVEDESDAALADHRIQGFGRDHQVREIGCHTRHVCGEHDIDKLRQGRSEEQQFVALFESHSPNDTRPEMYLFYKSLSADPAPEIHEGVVAVTVRKDTALHKLPECFYRTVLHIRLIFSGFSTKLISNKPMKAIIKCGFMPPCGTRRMEENASMCAMGFCPSLLMARYWS